MQEAAIAERGVVGMRPFLPARDFEISLRFSADLGFEPRLSGEGLASMQLGAFAFLLQAHCVREWAESVMMHLLVRDPDAWWERIERLDLGGRYGARAPAEPKLQS